MKIAELLRLNNELSVKNNCLQQKCKNLAYKDIKFDAIMSQYSELKKKYEALQAKFINQKEHGQDKSSTQFSELLNKYQNLQIKYNELYIENLERSTNTHIDNKSPLNRDKIFLTESNLMPNPIKRKQDIFETEIVIFKIFYSLSILLIISNA